LKSFLLEQTQLNYIFEVNIVHYLKMLYSQILKNNFRDLAKRWQLGKLAYKLYYAPKGALQNTWRKGLINTVIDAWAQQQMEQAAYQLPTISSRSCVTPLEIHFLTGKKFWYQTCFCAYSMARYIDLPILPVIYDDGSLEEKHQNAIRQVFPNAKIFLKSELDIRVEEYLPADKFPYLRERRQNYPNIRKLTDIHAGSRGWKLVLDSDMLFFRAPTILLDWLKSPQTPCHMVDTESAYGYPETLMASLAKAPIADKLNVGICGLNSDDIDWEQLEYWCKTMIEQQGTHYYQEQALVAMLMAGKPCTVAPATEYIVMPNQAEVIQPQAILHHYVADSKSWYFRVAWKYVLQHHQPELGVKAA